MAYNPVPTVTTGDLWTASNHNTYIRDNFAAGVPDIFEAKGDIAVASGANAAGRLPVGSNGQILMADSSRTLGVKWGSMPTIPSQLTYGKFERLKNQTISIASGYTPTVIPMSQLIFGSHLGFSITSGMMRVPSNGDYLTIVEVDPDLAAAAGSTLYFSQEGTGQIGALVNAAGTNGYRQVFMGPLSLTAGCNYALTIKATSPGSWNAYLAVNFLKLQL